MWKGGATSSSRSSLGKGLGTPQLAQKSFDAAFEKIDADWPAA